MHVAQRQGNSGVNRVRNCRTRVGLLQEGDERRGAFAGEVVRCALVFSG